MIKWEFDSPLLYNSRCRIESDCAGFPNQKDKITPQVKILSPAQKRMSYNGYYLALPTLRRGFDSLHSLTMSGKGTHSVETLPSRLQLKR